MKLIVSSTLAWLASLAIILVSLGARGEPLSRADVFGFGTVSLALTLLFVALVYLPGLTQLRRWLGGTRPAVLFPVAGALPLNVPAFLVLARLAGRTMVREEAMTFALAALAAGTVFGACFVWRERTRGTTRVRFLKLAGDFRRSHTCD